MKHRFLTIGACAAVFSISGTNWGAPAPLSVQGRLAKSPESPTTAALKALVGSSGSRLVEIRALGSSGDPSAAAKLLEIFEENQSQPDALVELELVRALASHTDGAQREAVIRALLVLFELKASVFAERPQLSSASSDAPELSSGGLFQFARGSAALALAQAQHPEAARVLVLTALQPTQEDVAGVSFAREALNAFPMSAATTQSLGALVDPRSLKLLKKQDSAPELPVKGPADLARLGQISSHLADPLSLSPRENSQTLSTWRDVIEALASRESWPNAFLEEESWEKAAQIKGPWTLRALALLVPSRPSLRKVAERAARQSLTSRDINQRSAAAFLLAVLSPENAAGHLDSKDEVVRNAVLSQASTGTLAQAAFDRASSALKKRTSRQSSFENEAFRISLHEPTTWAHWSTRSLWDLGGSARFTEWTSPLAARMSPGPGEGAPSVSQVATWLSDAAPQLRASIIFGLARSDTPSARGLLLTAYRTETDVAVRRGICRAFWQKQMHKNETVAQLIRLDPDGGCRALAHGQIDPDARHFRVLRAASTKVEITDRVGSAHLVFPAPDGFVGLVGADL